MDIPDIEGHGAGRAIRQLYPDLANDAAVLVALLPLDPHGFVEYQPRQVFLGSLSEGWGLLGRVNPLEADLVLLVVGVQCACRVAIGHPHDTAVQHVGMGCAGERSDAKENRALQLALRSPRFRGAPPNVAFQGRAGNPCRLRFIRTCTFTICEKYYRLGLDCTYAGYYTMVRRPLPPPSTRPSTPDVGGAAVCSPMATIDSAAPRSMLRLNCCPRRGALSDCSVQYKW